MPVRRLLLLTSGHPHYTTATCTRIIRTRGQKMQRWRDKAWLHVPNVKRGRNLKLSRPCVIVKKNFQMWSIALNQKAIKGKDPLFTLTGLKDVLKTNSC